MEQERYQPTPKEIIKARSNMTLEQKESSTVREAFFEQEHRLIEMPADLKYGAYGCAAGNYEVISGTFDGRFLRLETGAATGVVVGFADDEALSRDEATSLWGKIAPLARKFDEYKKAEAAAMQNLQEEIVKRKVRPEDLRPGEPKFRIKDGELAHELALKEKEKRGEIEGLLRKNIEGVEMSEGDRSFVEKMIGEIIELEVARNPNSFIEDQNTEASIDSVLRIRAWDREGNPTTPEKNDEYKRKRSLLYKLLGVNADNGQPWVAGFAATYVHSRVYDTTLSDVVVRESYETEYQRVGSGSQVHIERNSRYQKKDQEQK
jgi:hypothetical protein